MRIIAMSDIRGHYQEFTRNLRIIRQRWWNAKEDIFIFCGDYIDGGPDSLKSLKVVKTLCEKGHAKAVLGDHEVMFLEWLFNDDSSFQRPWPLHLDDSATLRDLTSNGFIHAVKSETYGRDEEPQTSVFFRDRVRDELMTRHPEIIKWLLSIPLVLETESQIFVHAGINESAGDKWQQETDPYAFVESEQVFRRPFSKDVIAGHIPTSSPLLSGDPAYQGVFWDGSNHYYLNGSVEKTGNIPMLIWDSSDGSYMSPVRSKQGGWIGADREVFRDLVSGDLAKGLKAGWDRGEA